MADIEEKSKDLKNVISVSSDAQPEGSLVKPKLIRGGPRKYSRASIAKLRTLGCDPLVEMVELHKKLVTEIKRQEELRDMAAGGLKLLGKYSSYAHSKFLEADQKLLNDLLPYKYAKVPVEVDLTNRNIAPMVINLTKEGDMFIVDPEENQEGFSDEDYNEESIALKGDNE